MKTTKKSQDLKKGEDYLTRVGVIQKIGVYCYIVNTTWLEIDGNYIDSNSENIIIIGINKEQLEESTKKHYNEDDGKDYTYNLKETLLVDKDEVVERFNLSESNIQQILNGENFQLDESDCYGTDYYSDCKLSIEELRAKRKTDSEDFDSDDIISKIASEYILTPKRKQALIKSIKGLK